VRSVGQRARFRAFGVFRGSPFRGPKSVGKVRENHGTPKLRLAPPRVSTKTARLTSSQEDRVPADPRVHRIAWWRWLALLPFGLLLRAWGRSLRFEATPEDIRRYTRHDVPVAIVLWHNRLFLAAEIVRRYRIGRPAYALVSASEDGAWLSAFFAMGGLRTVRGSSSRLGREAASALVEVLQSGRDVGITPDGPRGPCYDFKPGAVIVARRTRAPMILVGAEFTSSWRLRSWDRFHLPRPFSRVRMRCEIIEPEQLADRVAGMELVRSRLLALNPDR
jgi:lysophospholipid acyltransferase (LPLAT)-like uncharacterized protein